MKKLRAAVVGAGNRGQTYCNYALSNKDELEIVAAVDPNHIRLEDCKNKYGIADDKLFTDLDKFLEQGIECDFVINGTMDHLHYESAMKLIEKGYNLILEKPITPTYDQLEDIYKLAKKKNVRVDFLLQLFYLNIPYLLLYRYIPFLFLAYSHLVLIISNTNTNHHM